MIVEDQEDFSCLVRIGNNLPIHIREIAPKDFVYAQILRNGGKPSSPLLLRLILNESVLDTISATDFRHFVDWAGENIFLENIFSVENWLEVAFHLNKQRWDSAIDWLEQQPMSKIKTMLEINKKFAEQQESEMKKSSRKR